MTVYTFAIQWPAPFKKGWQHSGRRWATANQAGEALADFLAIALENGTSLEGRLIEVANSEVNT